VEQIVNELTVTYKAIGKNPYSGVTIDFESIGSANRENFTTFLRQLSVQLKNVPDKQLSLYVCVMPVPSGSSVTTNAYDYKAIGALADKVILMAHDYDARSLTAGTTGYTSQPTAPLGRIYPGPAGRGGIGRSIQGGTGFQRPEHRLADRQR
jgi:spore germination protein YaaH